MSKKDSERDSLRYLETPTAAFPIGALGLDGNDESDDEDEEKTALRNLARDLDLEETRPRRRPRLPRREEDRDTDVMVSRAQLDDLIAEAEPRSPRGVHPVLLALSLLGGGLLALGVVAVFGLWLL